MNDCKLKTDLNQSETQILLADRQLQCQLQQILMVWRWTLICKTGWLNMLTRNVSMLTSPRQRPRRTCPHSQSIS